MSDTRGLLDRISAFRRRLDSTPHLIPEALPVEPAEPADGPHAAVSEAEAFRLSLRRIAGTDPLDRPDGPLPQFTDRAQELLARAKHLLDRQKAFTADPFFAACAAGPEPDALVGYHRETVAALDTLVRTAQAFPDSPGAQLKLCEGLGALLAIVQDRMAVQTKVLHARKLDADRTDRLAGFFTALHCHLPAGIETVVGLAEELLADARKGAPIRWASAPVASTHAPGGGVAYPVPARFVAAHALNVAQVVARIVPHDYEWATRPVVPTVAALLMDCGMLVVPSAVLSKAEPLAPDDRRQLEAHPKLGAELLLWRFPTLAGPLAAGVAAHHERADGTGYPAAVRGDDVPPLAQLLRAADVYAALREDRPHRPALDAQSALGEVLALAGRDEVHPDFAAHLRQLTAFPVGTAVELTDGRVGVVVAAQAGGVDPSAPGRQVVAVLTDAAGGPLPCPEHLDLSAADRTSIVKAVPAARRREL
ncbi:MAG: HD domain-containing protein, partial [Gemmataceae bacterium]|nr:HD domain-containing protein [Gemmataceae bacterium]